MSEREWRQERWMLPPVLLRVLLLLLLAITVVLSNQSDSALLWVGLLTLTAIPSVIVPLHPIWGRLARFAEVAVAAVTLVLVGGPNPWIELYLIAPIGAAAMFGGLEGDRVQRPSGAQNWLLRNPGIVEAGILTLITITFLGGAAAPTEQLGDVLYMRESAVALALGLLAGFSGHWLRQLLHSEVPSGARPYAEAAALLTQLRAVARQLPGGTLDPGGIATALLEQLRAEAPVDRAALLIAGGGGNRLVVLAQEASERVDWETSLAAHTMMSDTWVGQQVHTGTAPLTRSGTGPVSSLVVPLIADRRTVGLVLMESDEPDNFGSDVVEAVVSNTSGAALRLETALLFDEVKSLATAEERQRLAREIHDGIAQELAMLGYGVDAALAQLPNEAQESAAQLQDLRDEVTRLVTELRLSLFELRSEVDRHGGLTTAIADYARTVGSSAGLRVHLSLDEGGARLPAATEAELLRIAQEAITNARKHAHAENLWVNCEVDPPYARVEVTDDGQGLSGDPNDSRYGLTIMSERAERIRGSLEIRPRIPHGTTVTVLLAASERPGTVSSEAARELPI